MTKIDELTIVVNAKNMATKELARLNRQIGGIANTVKKYRTELRAASKVMVGVAALGIGLFVGAVNSAAEFEQSLANVSAVTKANIEDQKRLKDSALEMGAKSVFSASQAAQAQLFLGQAGQTTTQIIASLDGVMDLAAATSADLGFAAEVTASTLSQFGLEAGEASRVANVFAASSSVSQANINKLAFAMRQAGPIAKSLGLSLETTTASLNLLFNAGFKGEQAGTILRGVLTKLAKPTKESADLIEELGIKINDSSGKMIPFIEIIKQLETANLTTAQAITLFGQEAGPGLLSLLGFGSEALEKMTADITGTNEAARQAKVRMDSLFGSITQLKSAVEVAAITIGDEFVPMIRAITESMIGWVAAFNGMDDSLKALFANIALGVIVLTGFVGIMGLMATSTAGIIVGMKKLGITVGGTMAIIGKFAGAITVASLAWDFGSWLNQFKIVRKTMTHFMEFFHAGFIGLGLVWNAFLFSIVSGIRELVDMLPSNALFDAISSSLGEWASGQDEAIEKGINDLKVLRENWAGVREEIEHGKQVMQDAHIQAFLSAKKEVSAQREIIESVEDKTEAIKKGIEAVNKLADADLKVLEIEKSIVAEQLKSANERRTALKQILDIEESLSSFLEQLGEKGLSQEEKDKSNLIRQEQALASITRASVNEKLAMLREVRFLEGEEKEAVLKKLQERSLDKRVEGLRRVVEATKTLALSAEHESSQEIKARDIAIKASEELKRSLTSLAIIHGQVDVQALKAGKSIEDQYRKTLHEVDQLEAKFDVLREKIKDIKARITLADQDKAISEARTLRANLESQFSQPIIQEVIIRQSGTASFPIQAPSIGRVTTSRTSSGISIRGFASGLNRVPYNNFPALLHRGEKVLTANQASGSRKEININFGDIILQNGDPEEFIREVIPLIRSELSNLEDRTD